MTNPSKLAADFIKNRKMPLPIIDAHAHMGANYGTYMSKATMDEMVEVMDRENIEMVFCAPHSALFDPGIQNGELEIAMHSSILEYSPLQSLMGYSSWSHRVEHN